MSPQSALRPSAKAIHLLLLLWLTLLPLPTIAATATPSNLSTLQRQADQAALADTPRWQRLLRYEAGESLVSTDAFFLAADGRRNPTAELHATLAALLEPLASVAADQHARCRFPARAHWLASQLNAPELAERGQACPRLKSWLGETPPHSTSLVFVSGYMGNPASLFGHLLLKRNDRDNLGNQGLLDTSINYGAVVPENENGLVYVVRGLFGGYVAGYSDTRFYTLNHLYGENELRDLWEYQLNLDPDQQQLLWLHLWEVLPVEFRYYFLRDNCALFMARLLETVLDGPELIPPGDQWAIPVEVFHAINERTTRGHPLVSDIQLLPSRQRHLEQSYGQLAPDEQIRVKALIEAPETLLEDSMSGFTTAARIRISDTLIDYFRFRLDSAQSHAESTPFRRGQQLALLTRSQLPLQTDSPRTTPHRPPPTDGNKPAALHLAHITQEHQTASLEVGWRAAYHDLLERPDGHADDAALVVMDIRFRHDDEGSYLERLQLFSVENLNLSRTGLPGDGGPAWNLALSYERPSLACGKCAELRLRGGLGKATRLTGRGHAYAMLDGRLRAQGNLSEAISTHARTGLLLRAGTTHALHLEAGRIWNEWGGKQTKAFDSLQVNYRYAVNRTWELRAQWAYAEAHEGGITLSYHH